jgi:hypothetical protein
MDDAVTTFLAALFIIIVGAVFYILWDNSCKKFAEVAERQDACMEAIDARFAAADVMLGTIAKMHPIYKDMYNNVKKAHEAYTNARTNLDNCIKHR